MIKTNNATITFANGLSGLSNGISINNLANGSMNSKLIFWGRSMKMPILSKMAIPIRRMILNGFMLLNCWIIYYYLVLVFYRFGLAKFKVSTYSWKSELICFVGKCTVSWDEYFDFWAFIYSIIPCSLLNQSNFGAKFRIDFNEIIANVHLPKRTIKLALAVSQFVLAVWYDE